MGELVTLYTTNELSDLNPQPYQYYLDYTADQCMEVAIMNIGMRNLPNLQLLLRSPTGDSQWLDPAKTLREHGVQSGMMILVLTQEIEGNEL